MARRSLFRNATRAIGLCLITLALGVSVLGQASADYLIGPKDVLAITVYDQADLTGKYTVEADGTFTFWIIGRVKAGGLTLRQFETELRAKLADGYFKNPQVSVGVDQYKSQRVFVVGDVRVPGEYPLTGAMNLIELLAKAGATPTGDVVIVHKSDGKEAPVIGAQVSGDQVRRVDMKSLQSGTENVELKDGDTIFVPQPDTIYVAGFVKNAGAYPVRRDTTVLQALVLAGGATPEGATNRIRIVRFVDGKKVEIKVQLSDLVKPGDTIIVPERYF